MAPSNSIKGILFDKDGTLLDFNGTWLEPYFKVTELIANYMDQPALANELMEKGGYIAESQSWVCESLLASGSNAQILKFWSKLIGQPIQGELLNEVREIFSQVASSYIPAIDNLRELLFELKSHEIKLGLATMDDVSNAHGMLNQLELSDLFDFVCGADSGYGVKPEPGMVLAFCDSCGLSPGNIIMVGDSPRDLEMGKNAGAGYTVGVLTGAHNRIELEKHTNYVYDNIAGINSLLKIN